MRLFRFISPREFFGLVDKKMERFVLPWEWEDTYEAFLLSRFHDSKEKQKTIIEYLLNEKSLSDETVIEFFTKVEYLYAHSYVKCYSKCEESAAMWSIYSFANQAVRIETSEEAVKEILSHFGHGYLRDVEYTNDIDAETILKRQINELVSNRDLGNVITQKRAFFSHEAEMRAVVVDNKEDLIRRFSEYAAHHNMGRSQTRKDNTMDAERLVSVIDRVNPRYYPSRELYISFSDPEQYIRSVYLHPHAEEWYVEIIRDRCSKLGIQFLGRSPMYDVPALDGFEKRL